jgi:Bacteriophage Mu, Gp27
MGVRSKVVTVLPRDVQGELDRRLIDGSFSNYRGLAKWLAQKGFQISRGSLQRYGSSLERSLARIKRVTEQAKSVVESSAGDRRGSLNDALVSLVQSHLFGALAETEDIDETSLTRFARAIADLGRASVMQKRFAELMRQRLAAVGVTVGEQAARGGLSPEAEQAIRAALLAAEPSALL